MQAEAKHGIFAKHKDSVNHIIPFSVSYSHSKSAATSYSEVHVLKMFLIGFDTFFTLSKKTVANMAVVLWINNILQAVCSLRVLSCVWQTFSLNILKKN